LPALAQNQAETTAIEKNLPKLEGKARIDALISLCKKYFATDIAISMTFAKEALAEAQKIQDYNSACSALQLQGIIYNNTSQFKEEINCYKTAIEYANKLSNNALVANLHIECGDAYLSLKEFINSLDYYQKAKKIIENSVNKSGSASVLVKIGLTYYRMTRYEDALSYFFQALKLKENSNDKIGTANILLNIGSIYYDLKFFDKAFENNNKALEISKKANLKNYEAMSYNNLGNCYQEIGDYKQARSNHEKSLFLRRQLNNDQGIGTSLNNLGNTYDALGKFTTAGEYYLNALKLYKQIEDLNGIVTSYTNLGTNAIKTGQVEKAKDYLDEAKKIIDENELTELKPLLFYSYAIYYSNAGDHIKSDQYYRAFTRIKDSLNNEENKRNIADLQVRYDTERKQRENDVLKLEKEKNIQKINQQRVLVIFLVIILVLILGLSLIIYQFYINKKNTSKILADKNLELEETNLKLTKSEENLMRINATKDKFFSIIAHDLRNPFASLILSVDMLKKYYDRIDKENMDKIVNTISMTVHQSDELLTNLLEWARAQTDSLKFEPQILNLLPIILDVMPIIKGSAFPKNIKVDTNVDHDLTVFADLNMLNTILRNIVSNAIKFTPRDGSIIITAENENDKIKLTVTDNGVGIEPENLQKLFRIETKFKTKGTDNESGTGLGLILCKEFIEKHNGKIWAESEFGKGTKFIFTLPKTLI
jgi:signal transduction histidine kinase/uncharacterized protein HemY